MHIKQIELIRPINSGRYGSIYKAYDHKSKHFRAAKVLPKKRHDVNPRDNLDMINREVTNMLKVRGHPHIVELYDVLQDDENYYLIEELCGGPTLHESLLTGKCSVRARLQALRNIAAAIAECHDSQILFCDLKPKNVVYSPEQATYKLTDFGSSVDLLAPIPQRIITATRDYAAPELIETMHASLPYDVWSIGIIAYLMFYHTMPPTQSPITTPPLAKTEPQELRSLISQALQQDPAKRPTAKQIESFLNTFSPK